MTAKVNFQATGELNQPGTMVFDVSGSKGSGQIIAQQEGDSWRNATLKLPSGETFDLSSP